jgi:hypothetical protein
MVVEDLQDRVCVECPKSVRKRKGDATECILYGCGVERSLRGWCCATKQKGGSQAQYRTLEAGHVRSLLSHTVTALRLPNAMEFSCGLQLPYTTKLLGVAVSYNSSLGRGSIAPTFSLPNEKCGFLEIAHLA